MNCWPFAEHDHSQHYVCIEVLPRFTRSGCPTVTQGATGFALSQPSNCRGFTEQVVAARREGGRDSRSSSTVGQASVALQYRS